MVVKGYYASLCQGLSVVGSFFSLLAGLGLAGLGAYLATNRIASEAYRLGPIGYLMLVMAVLVLSMAICGMIGACAEKLVISRISFGLALLNVLLLLGCAGFVFMQVKQVKEGALMKIQAISS